MSPIEMWGPSGLEVDAEGWKAQESLGMKMEVGCGARKGEIWRVNMLLRVAKLGSPEEGMFCEKVS